MKTSDYEGLPDDDALGPPLPEMTVSELEQRAQAYAMEMLTGTSSEGREIFNRYAEQHPARVKRALAAYKRSFQLVMSQHFLVVMDQQAEARPASTFAPSY
ncbi:hypothetical protein LJ656_27430 [Paraburkholderia sp. MMS20-SJTR3]|uniref:Uncharacterized protein n=1 Tax=Paraburkholderia sejongensis TaxID=2886946 RepID=A0ABS8K2F0_9BURK|nr:hypothetical protein [Paraburkholderia sp. MMS20-SJTR3]MCC8396327.1 hypothetical protein [Paraburkholderia sp. MMS20-SJTR3]